MAEPFKICPICETANHRNAMMCVTCGTSLADVAQVDSDRAKNASSEPVYDYRYGETDLLEQSLSKKGRAYLLGFVSVLLAIMALGVGLLILPLLDLGGGGAPAGGGVLPDFSTSTQAPTPALATVTEGPPTVAPTLTPTPSPTITVTPTREPCLQTVGAGEGLYALVARCGHRDLGIIDEVVRINNLNDATSILAGQVLEIPWPTETPDPNAALSETPPAGQDGDTSAADALMSLEGGSSESVGFGLSDEDIAATQAVDPFFRPTPTNPPGIADYTIKAGDNISTIIVEFNTTIEIMEQLNPQVAFSQCDFGTRFGGERCIVLLAPGQLIRVPAPTPTPTLSPTPSGSETPTPTATPTFNAPNASSPSNRAYFRRDEFVTLRWTSSGILGENEVYQLIVDNLTTGETFTAETVDLFFVLPDDWQGGEARQYEYEWRVGVVDETRPDVLRYPTQPRTFTWEGQGN